MMRRYDAIVIGGGLNGLTAAAYLARAGRDVLLLDRSAELGGVDAGYEITPGFRLPRFRLGTTTLSARIVTELELAEHGLRYVRVDDGISLGSDYYHANYRDGMVHRRELARFSPKDSAAWTGFRRRMLHAAAHLQPLLARRMPDISRRSWSSLLELRKIGNRLAEVPAHDIADLAQLWSLSCADFLDLHFESDVVKSHLAGSAMMGSALGPYSPTSARFLMTPYLDDAGDTSCGTPAKVHAVGGVNAIAKALASAIEAYGGSIRTEAEVTDILLRGGAAYGVALANGEEIFAEIILSDLDVKRTFLSLMPWKALPDGFVERVANIRMSGSVAKMNLALDAAPKFLKIPEDCPALLGGIRLPASIADMESAFGDWRDGIPPRTPLIELQVPSLLDRSLAPAGSHVMSIVVQYVPETLHDGAWTDERKTALHDLVLSRLEEQSPGLASHILACDFLVPSEIETESGVTSGDLMQGDLTLDQMFFNRPLPELAGYETPIHNLYLCSDSTHPGSLSPGGAGANTASLLLASAKGRK